MEVDIVYRDKMTSGSLLLRGVMQICPRIVLARCARTVLLDRAEIFGEYALAQHENPSTFDQSTPKPSSSRRVNAVELITSENRKHS